MDTPMPNRNEQETLLDTATRTAFRTVNRVVTPVVKAGLGSPFPVGGGLVVLETKGRRSGLPREVPLASIRFGDRVVVSTLRATSQWLKNLEATPESRVWVSGRARPATAGVRRGRLSIATLDLQPAA